MLARCFVTLLDFLCMEFVLPNGPCHGQSFTPTQTDSKCMPKWARVHMNSIGVFGTQFHFMPWFRTYGVCSFRWNPSWRKVSHWLGRIWNACQNELGRIWAPSEVLALSFISFSDFVLTEFVLSNGTRHWVKFRTKLDGFETHAKMSYIASTLQSGCSTLSFVSCLDFVWMEEFLLPLEPVVEETFTPT